MSGGAVRKIQPFTIGTKLSVPTEQKYHDTVDNYLPKSTPNNCDLRSNLNDHGGSLSPDQVQSGPATAGSPDVDEQVGHQGLSDDEEEAEDRNSISPTISSRSIKKIAICRNADVVHKSPGDSDTGMLLKLTSDINSLQPPLQLATTDDDLEKRSCSYSKEGLDCGKVETDQKEEMTGSKTNFPGENTSDHFLRWLLKNYQQDVKLALDVSSFYQQADSIISTINRKRTALSRSAELRGSEHAEIQDIASQIAMLDETVSRLSDLHPTLAARVTQKQAEVNESWDLLHQALNRSDSQDLETFPMSYPNCDRPGNPMSYPNCDSPGDPMSYPNCDSPGDPDNITPFRELQSSTGHQASRLIGEDIKEEQNYLKESVSLKTDGETDGTPLTNYTRILIDIGGNTVTLTEEPHEDRTRGEQTTPLNTCSEEDHPELGVVLQEPTSTAKTLSWLKDNVSVATATKPWMSMTGPETSGGQTVSISKDDIMPKTNTFSQSMRNSSLTLRINQLLSRCAELSMDILDIETDMVVRCEPGISELEGLQEQQDKLEMDLQTIKEEVEEVEEMETLVPLPEEAGVLGDDVQATLQAWEELGWSVAENQSCLQQFLQMQNFLRTYVAMISWAEETRACIFSEVSMQRLRQVESTELSELDLRIQQKFVDFDELAETGQRLTADRHHLADIITERTEELQSMLEWIMVHWKAQKDRSDQRKQESIHGSAHQHKIVSPQFQSQPLLRSEDPNKSSEYPLPERRLETAVIQLKGPHTEGDVHEENSSKTAFITQQSPLDMVAKSPSLALEEPCATVTPLGGSINVILTFDQQSPGGSQLNGPVEQQEPLDPVHRVSTYLQVTDGNKESPVCRDVASGNRPSAAQMSANPQTSSTTATFLPKVSTVILPTSPKTNSISTINLKATAKRKKKASHRHTVTGVAGVDRIGEAALPTGLARRANTWPLEDKKGGQIPESPENSELQLYIKNNSVITIAKDNNSVTSNGPIMNRDDTTEKTNDQEKTQYSIPLGSTLSFDLPKNWEGISHISPKGLIVEKRPPESIGEYNSPHNPLPNLYRPLGQSDQTNASSKVLIKTFTAGAEGGSSEDDGAKPQGVSSECIAVLCSPPLETDKCRCDQAATVKTNDHSILHQSSSSSNINGFNKEAKEEFSKQGVTSDVHKDSAEPVHCIPMTHDNAYPTKQVHNQHNCLSIHTKICDLKDHMYWSPAKQQFTCQSGVIAQETKGASTGTANSLSCGVCKTGRVIVCSEEDCFVCSHGSVPGMAPSNDSPHRQVSEKGSDPVHPDHWQFEEEEDELEDIWNGVDRERAP